MQPPLCVFFFCYRREAVIYLATDFAKQNAGLCEPADGLKHAQQFWLNAPSASGWALGFVRIRLSCPSGITQKELKVSFLRLSVHQWEWGCAQNKWLGYNNTYSSTHLPTLNCNNLDFIAVQAGRLWILSQGHPSTSSQQVRTDTDPVSLVLGTTRTIFFILFLSLLLLFTFIFIFEHPLDKDNYISISLRARKNWSFSWSL